MEQPVQAITTTDEDSALTTLFKKLTTARKAALAAGISPDEATAAECLALLQVSAKKLMEVLPRCEEKIQVIAMTKLAQFVSTLSSGVESSADAKSVH